jgi:hypothetical protein
MRFGEPMKFVSVRLLVPTRKSMDGTKALVT